MLEWTKCPQIGLGNEWHTSEAPPLIIPGDYVLPTREDSLQICRLNLTNWACSPSRVYAVSTSRIWTHNKEHDPFLSHWLVPNENSTSTCAPFTKNAWKLHNLHKSTNRFVSPSQQWSIMARSEWTSLSNHLGWIVSTLTTETNVLLGIPSCYA